MERESAEFHDRVREAYRARAAAAADRYLVVDGQGSLTTIQEQVRRRVLALIASEKD
jgi:dTMP kinase